MFNISIDPNINSKQLLSPHLDIIPLISNVKHEYSANTIFTFANINILFSDINSFFFFSLTSMHASRERKRARERERQGGRGKRKKITREDTMKER